MNNQNQILSWMAESLNSFIAELSLSKSDLTIEAYRYDVAKFLEYLCEEKVKRISSLKPAHIVKYLGFCKERGKSDSSINRYYMAIRCYCRFLRKTKTIQFDLTEDIEAPRNHQKAPNIPTVEEIERILAQPDTSTEDGLRDRAILELLYSSGLRASELCALQFNHVEQNKVVVSCGKRGKTRTVPLTKEAFTWVFKYVNEYRGNEKGPLFLTKMSKPLWRQKLCKMVMSYAKKANVQDVTTHTLRHACATHLLNEGADLLLIQKVLGHSSIASTQRYTHLSSSKMNEMFNKFHPRKTQE